MRKPRADAWHAGLSVEQLDRVFSCANERGYVRAAELVRDELQRKVSVGALSIWYQSWPLQRAWLTAGSVAEQIKAAARDLPQLNLNSDQVDAVGQLVFQTEAIRQMNPEAWERNKRLAQRDREIALVERRVALLEKRAEQADRTDAVLTDGALTEDERRRKIAEIYGRA